MLNRPACGTREVLLVTAMVPVKAFTAPAKPLMSPPMRAPSRNPACRVALLADNEPNTGPDYARGRLCILQLEETGDFESCENERPIDPGHEAPLILELKRILM